MPGGARARGHPEPEPPRDRARRSRDHRGLGARLRLHRRPLRRAPLRRLDGHGLRADRGRARAANARFVAREDASRYRGRSPPRHCCCGSSAPSACRSRCASIAFPPPSPRGEVEAGVIIHESQLTYRDEGLVKVLDFGELWMERDRLPVPLGLDVVRRDLGPELMGAASVGLPRQHPGRARPRGRRDRLRARASAAASTLRAGTTLRPHVRERAHARPGRAGNGARSIVSTIGPSRSGRSSGLRRSSRCEDEFPQLMRKG